MSKPSARTGLGSLATGAVTAAALVVQTGLAALVGVIIAREFGRTAETDGLFAAYGVFIVLALAANAIRLVVLPPLARARDDRRLGQETAAWAAALGTIALPLLAVTVVAAGPLAAVLTGSGPAEAQETAADALPLLTLAGVGQVYAGLAASALAALDDYRTAALGYISASVVGIVVILVRLDEGVVAVAEGMALNALVAVAIPVVALAVRARRAAMPAAGVRPERTTLGNRIRRAGRGIALPLGLQAAYLVCLPLAAREGVGAVTSFGYAYIAGSAIVAITAASLGLVTSVPLTRLGLDRHRVAHHVVASSWLALVAVGATAGLFAVAGEPIVAWVLGADYTAAVGTELGRLVALFAPWMVAAIGFSVTLPLVFVAESDRRLVLLGVLVVAVQVPLAVVGQALFGLTGLVLALACTTAIAFAGLLHLFRATGEALLGVGKAAAVVGALAVAAFVVAALVPSAEASGLLGLGLYALALVVVRPGGLTSAARYLRTLA